MWVHAPHAAESANDSVKAVHMQIWLCIVWKFWLKSCGLARNFQFHCACVLTYVLTSFSLSLSLSHTQTHIHIHIHTTHIQVRRPTIIALDAPSGTLLNQEITITCTAAINANITLTVEESNGASLPLTDVETTDNSRSVNLIVMYPGQHNVTCVADNSGLTEMNTTQFYGISKLWYKYGYMYALIKAGILY